MPKVMRNMKQHDFYCLNCGTKNYTLFRQVGRLKEKWHRKVMYCPICHTDINHVEVKNEAEAFEFKEAFAAGEFKEEAIESINYKEDLV